MKRLIWVCMMAAMALQGAFRARAADLIYTVTVTLTNTPADSDSITVNGAVRTFKTTVAAPATEVARGASALEAAQNYGAQLATYGYTGVSASQNATVMTLIGTQNRTITASKSGSWGTLAVATNVISSFPMVVPLSSIPNTTGRVHIANLLISDLSTYPTQLLSATATAFQNFVSLSESQTITGAKNYRGANNSSNSSQAFLLGTIASALLTNIPNAFISNLYAKNFFAEAPIYLTNSFPSVIFHAAGGNTDEKRTLLFAYGNAFGATAISDDGGTTAQMFQVTRSGVTPVGFQIFPMLYPQGGVYGAALTNGSTTNMAGGFLGLWATSVNVAGNIGATNDAPTITLYDTGGTANDKLFKIVADGDALHFQMLNDAGTLVSTPLMITRTDGTGSATFSNLVVLKAGALVVGQMNIDGSVSSSGTITAGNPAPSPPSGLVGGFYLVDGTAPSADPATGAVIFTDGGALKYRASTEGSGGTHWLHNRTATVAGSGSDYTLTGSTATVDFGGTDPRVTLPTAGTYWINAQVSVTGAASNDDMRFKLRNETAASDLTSSDAWVSSLLNNERAVVTLTGTVTGAASDVVGIWGHNATSARGTVESARTKISYIRLY